MECPQCEFGAVEGEEELVRELRRLVSCVVGGLGLRFIAVDNGPRYSALFYIEARGGEAERVVGRVVECIRAAAGDLVRVDSVKRLDDSFVVVLGRDCIVVKSTV